MPTVLVVPVYVEIPGIARGVMALEEILRRAGYIFLTGEPLHETLEQTKKMHLKEGFTNPSDDGQIGAGLSP